MIALVLAAVLGVTDPELEGVVLEPCTVEHPCDPGDAPRLKVTLVNESARADKAEKRAALLEQSAAVAQRIAQEERQSSLRWQAKAEELALPPPWYTSPQLWAGVGFVGGIALTLGVMAAVR